MQSGENAMTGANGAGGKKFTPTVPQPTTATKSLLARESSAGKDGLVRENNKLFMAFEFIKEEFRRDGRYSLQLMMAFFFTSFCVMSALLVKQQPSTIEDHHSVNPYNAEGEYSDLAMVFNYSLVFSLAMACVIVVDSVLCLVFIGSVDASPTIAIIEFCRRHVFYIVGIPNVMIFFGIFPVSVIDLVQYYQFIALYFVTLFRMYTLSTAQQQRMVSFSAMRDVFYSSFASAVMAFLYKMSIHGMIGGMLVYKVLYMAFMVVALVLGGLKLRAWFLLNTRLDEIMEQYAQTSSRLSFLGLLLSFVIICSVIVLNVVTFEQEMVFFPAYHHSYVLLEWMFCGFILSWNGHHNFELLKAELSIKGQLEYNRKMTRCISHEIRTPLNTAFLALELLIGTLQAPLTTDETDAMSKHRVDLLEISESIKEGCDISLGILNQLLTFEKLSAGMMQLESKAMNVSQMLESNMKLFKMQAQQVGIVFNLDEGQVDAHMLKLYVDEHKMNQVLRNLLSNAMKFTPKGGEVRIKLVHMNEDDRIEKMKHLVKETTSPNSRSNAGNGESSKKVFPFWTSQKKIVYQESVSKIVERMAFRTPVHTDVRGTRTFGTLLISIVDSGPGVSEDDQKKLFNEYVQINPGELQKGQGTGLGLCISKSIVQLHGGNIGMTSEGRGKGSTFFIELPCYVDLHSSSTDEISARLRPNANNGGGNGGGHSLFKMSKVVSARIAPTVSRAQSSSFRRKANSAVAVDTVAEGSKSQDNNSIVAFPVKTQTSETRIRTLSIESTEQKLDFLENGRLDEDSLVTAVDVYKSRQPSGEPTMSRLLQEASDGLVPECPPSPSPESLVSPYSRKVVRRMSFITVPKFFRILIVDDSAPNRKMLSRLLTRAGHFTYEADDGSTAVDLLNASILQGGSDKQIPGLIRYDFILMDYFMTRMNGPEAARLIREAGYDGPIIGVTGVMGDDSTEFINNGADIVLSKPVTVQSIWKSLYSIEFI